MDRRARTTSKLDWTRLTTQDLEMLMMMATCDLSVELATGPGAVCRERASRRDERAPDELVDLVSRIVDGEADALAELYDRTRVLVFSLARRILASPEEAEEISLDVYTQVWRSAAAYDPRRGSVEAWLVILTRSRALDRLRSLHARAHLSVTSAASLVQPDDAPSPDEIAIASETELRVRRALGDLPSLERRLVELAFFQGYTHSELSRSQSLPLGTVKTRIRAALQRLRARLAVEA